MSIQSFRIRSPLLIAAFVFARLVLPTGLRAADEPKPEAEPQRRKWSRKRSRWTTTSFRFPKSSLSP